MDTLGFDSRQLDFFSYFALPLSVTGDVLVTSKESSKLQMTVRGRPDGKAPVPHPYVLVSTDPQGDYVVSPSTPSPYSLKTGDLLLFRYLPGRTDNIGYSLQFNGGGIHWDSRVLSDGVIFGTRFMTAATFGFLAYLRDDGSGTYKPIIEGEVRVRADSAGTSPAQSVELKQPDPSMPSTKPVLLEGRPGLFVSWIVQTGNWYVVGTPKG